jgi:predicted GH43/DUF377 family glycosyl hydrolase
MFKQHAILFGKQFVMSNYPEMPLIAWNPAVYQRNSKMVLLPRLHFDNKFYVSSLGLCQPIAFKEVETYNNGARSIKTKLIKYPASDNDIRGVGDPKITEDGRRILTGGIGRVFGESTLTAQTTMSVFDGDKITASKPFLFLGSEINTGRDAVFLNGNTLLFRPEREPFRTYRAKYTETDSHIVISKQEVLPQLDKTKDAFKQGISTNAVGVSKEVYLVGYHAKLISRAEYRNGFLLLDKDGNITGMTDLILRTEGISRYAHRPFTIFGCGLILHKDKLWWAGGIGDSWIGIFSIDLDDVMRLFKEG